MGTDVSSCLKNFIRYFKDHPPSFAASPESTLVKVAGKRFHYDDLESLKKLFDATTILEYDLADWWRAPAEEKITWFINFIEGTYRREAIEAKRNRVELKEKLKSNGKSELDLPDAEYILTHLQPFRVLGDKRKEAGFNFIDTATGNVTDYDYHSVYFALRSGCIEKDIIEQFMTQHLHVREDYNPQDHYRYRLIPDTNNVYQVNRYIPPNWMKLSDVTPGLPDEIEKLTAHLFPEEACREFVFNWIYHSLTTRSGTYLYLCGGQGSGKNTLANVIGALHGIHNTSNPKQDSLTGRFNHYLKFKRFVFFDEFNCRVRRDKDTLKAIINDRIQIEGKNRDHEDITIHASYFLANNSLEAIGLDSVDRRFSVPDVTHESIINRYGPEFIPGLLSKLKDDRFVASLGFWILSEFARPRWGSEEPYQKSRFEEIVIATARMGIVETLSKVLKREQNEYDYYEEKDAFKRVHKHQTYPPIQDWLKFFREVRRGGKPLGEVCGAKFMPSSEYRVEGRT